MRATVDVVAAAAAAAVLLVVDDVAIVVADVPALESTAVVDDAFVFLDVVALERKFGFAGCVAAVASETADVIATIAVAAVVAAETVHRAADGAARYQRRHERWVFYEGRFRIYLSWHRGH